MYCLDTDQIHFKTNFTLHFINYIKTIQPIGADAKRKPSPPANHNLALRQLLETSPIVSGTMKVHVPLGQFPKPKTSLLYTRCLRAVNFTCIKSKVGLLKTAHSWANAGVLFGARVGRRVAFETIRPKANN